MILHVRSVVPEKIMLIFTEIVSLKEVKCIGGGKKNNLKVLLDIKKKINNKIQ